MEKSLYALYINERENYEIVESEKGFATYKIFPENKECYIRDIYVHPKFRDQKIASKMADEIAIMAKEKGCTHLTGSVDTNTNGSTTSVSVLLSYGFKIMKTNYSAILFIKELA